METLSQKMTEIITVSDYEAHGYMVFKKMM